MDWYKDCVNIRTRGKGLYPITDLIAQKIRAWAVQEGMCYLFIQHTSASLIINESFDPSARQDMEAFLERIAPDNAGWMRHTLEGPDDSTAHLRAMLLPVSLTIPVENGALCLGEWQGIYLAEHRSIAHQRTVILRCLSV